MKLREESISCRATISFNAADNRCHLISSVLHPIIIHCGLSLIWSKFSIINNYKYENSLTSLEYWNFVSLNYILTTVCHYRIKVSNNFVIGNGEHVLIQLNFRFKKKPLLNQATNFQDLHFEAVEALCSAWIRRSRRASTIVPQRPPRWCPGCFLHEGLIFHPDFVNYSQMEHFLLSTNP